MSDKKILNLGELLFKYRDYTPIPFIVLVIVKASADKNSLLIGGGLIILGELTRIISVSYIGGVSRTRTHSLGQKLVTGGPFGHVRNPLYLGNFFLSLGLVILGNIGLWWTLLFVALFFGQYGPIIRWEENNLKKVFGHEYEEYMKKTPRWIPSLSSPYVNEEKVKLNLGKTLVTEKHTLMTVVILSLVILWRSGWLDGIIDKISSLI